MTRRVPFTFRFDETFHAKLKVVAQKEGRSMSNLIEFLCRKEIERYEETYGEIVLSDDDFGLE